jgi:universal stress protein A
MVGYKKAVIALSLHKESDEAVLAKALWLIEGGIECHLIHATEYMVSYEAAFGMRGGADTEELLRQEAESYLQRLAEQHGLGDRLRAVLLGPTSASVVDYAAQQGADLIVVGNHPQHGLKLLQGSTANGVLHRAPCDVLALHLPE